MTTAEVGAYILLLCAQWDQGSIPGDDIRRLAVLMRCTPKTALGLWQTVSTKFERHEDGWRNARLETVRQEQADYRDGRSRSGKAGAEKRWQNHSKPIAQPLAKPIAKPSQNDGSSSPSSVFKNDPANPESSVSALPQSLPAPVRAPLIARGEARRFGENHAGHFADFCDWKCFPGDLAQQFAAQLVEHDHVPYTEAIQAVERWGHQVRASGIVPSGKWYDFWNAQWDATHGAPATVQDGAAGRAARTAKRLDRWVEEG